MSELNVRIVKLEPIRVAAALGYGASPEVEAWGKLVSWAESQGLLSEIQSHRFFGFNNPNPSPGSPNYGYEQWMTIDASTQPGGEVEIKEFSGGLYAVTRCQGTDNLPAAWQALVAWQEDSRFKLASHWCLEECLTPQHFLPLDREPAFGQVEFDLYLQVTE
jgi:DNA gyrase inhibitor GyrI